MIPNPGFIDLDDLAHRLLVTHRLLLHSMKKPSVLKVRKILYVIHCHQPTSRRRGYPLGTKRTDQLRLSLKSPYGDYTATLDVEARAGAC